MVWRAAVLGEARILLWGASAGVYRGFFCLPQRCALSGGLAARVVPFRCRWLLRLLNWVCDHFFSLVASRFCE